MVFNLVRKHDFTPTCFNFSSLTEVRQKWTDFPCFLNCKQRRFCNVSNNSHCIHQASLAPSLIVYKTFLCWPFQQWKNCLQGFRISLIAIINSQHLENPQNISCPQNSYLKFRYIKTGTSYNYISKWEGKGITG